MKKFLLSVVIMVGGLRIAEAQILSSDVLTNLKSVEIYGVFAELILDTQPLANISSATDSLVSTAPGASIVVSGDTRFALGASIILPNGRIYASAVEVTEDKLSLKVQEVSYFYLGKRDQGIQLENVKSVKFTTRVGVCGYLAAVWPCNKVLFHTFELADSTPKSANSLTDTLSELQKNNVVIGSINSTKINTSILKIGKRAFDVPVSPNSKSFTYLDSQVKSLQIVLLEKSIGTLVSNQKVSMMILDDKTVTASPVYNEEINKLPLEQYFGAN